MAGEKQGADQRAYVRVTVSYHAEVRLHGDERSLAARVLDLSGNGIRFWLPHRVDDDAAFAIRMQGDTPDSPTVVVSAHAVRVSPSDAEDGWEVACIFD